MNSPFFLRRDQSTEGIHLFLTDKTIALHEITKHAVGWAQRPGCWGNSKETHVTSLTHLPVPSFGPTNLTLFKWFLAFPVSVLNPLQSSSSYLSRSLADTISDHAGPLCYVPPHTLEHLLHCRPLAHIFQLLFITTATITVTATYQASKYFRCGNSLKQPHESNTNTFPTKSNLESNLPKIIANREVCCGLNACMLLKSISGNPNPQCDGIGWGFGRWLGHKGGALKNRINGLVKETPVNSLALSAMWRHSKKTAVYSAGSSIQILNLAAPGSWTCQPLEQWDTNAGYVSRPYMVFFWYSSWNGLRWCGTMRKSSSDSALSRLCLLSWRVRVLRTGTLSLPSWATHRACWWSCEGVLSLTHEKQVER